MIGGKALHLPPNPEALLQVTGLCSTVCSCTFNDLSDVLQSGFFLVWAIPYHVEPCYSDQNNDVITLFIWPLNFCCIEVVLQAFIFNVVSMFQCTVLLVFN